MKKTLQNAVHKNSRIGFGIREVDLGAIIDSVD